MPAYDVKCSNCGVEEERFKTFAQQKAGDTIEGTPCSCGGEVKILIRDVCVSQDATPTRGYGRSKNAPALVRKDGKPINPGHEPVTSDMIGLTKEQCAAHGLKPIR